jgi:hypothetical protein
VTDVNVPSVIYKQKNLGKKITDLDPYLPKRHGSETLWPRNSIRFSFICFLRDESWIYCFSGRLCDCVNRGVKLVSLRVLCSPILSLQKPAVPSVLRIHDILVWIRIRIRGSMPLAIDPDPDFSAYYFLKVHLLYIIFKR